MNQGAQNQQKATTNATTTNNATANTTQATNLSKSQSNTTAGTTTTLGASGTLGTTTSQSQVLPQTNKNTATITNNINTTQTTTQNQVNSNLNNAQQLNTATTGNQQLNNAKAGVTTNNVNVNQNVAGNQIGNQNVLQNNTNLAQNQQQKIQPTVTQTNTTQNQTQPSTQIGQNKNQTNTTTSTTQNATAIGTNQQQKPSTTTTSTTGNTNSTTTSTNQQQPVAQKTSDLQAQQKSNTTATSSNQQQQQQNQAQAQQQQQQQIQQQPKQQQPVTTVSQQAPVTDKDLQGKTPAQQREYLETIKTKLNQQLSQQQSLFVRQTSILARNTLQKKKDSIKMQKLIVAGQIEHDKFMLKRYEEKKIQAERELLNEEAVEQQILNKGLSQSTVVVNGTGANQTPLKADQKGGVGSQSQVQTSANKQDPSKPAAQTVQVSEKLKSDIELLKARIIENERIKLELEEFVDEKSEFMKQKSDLQIKSDGIKAALQRQNDQIKALDMEVEKRKQEEVEILKAQNNKANQSKIVLGKVGNSLRQHYFDEELRTLELQYEDMQKKIQTQILNQEQLAVEINKTQTLQTKVEDNEELKSLREDIQATRAQIAIEKENIEKTKQKIQSLEAQIKDIDQQYLNEETRNRELKGKLHEVNVIIEQHLEEYNAEKLSPIKQDQQLLHNDPYNQYPQEQQYHRPNLGLSNNFDGELEQTSASFNRQRTEANRPDAGQLLFGDSSLNNVQRSQLVQGNQGNLKKSQTSRRQEGNNLFDTSPAKTEETQQRKSVRFQDESKENQQPLLAQPKKQQKKNAILDEDMLTYTDLQHVQDSTVEKQKYLLQVESQSYDMLLFFIAVLTLLLIVNIYYQSYKSLDPLTSQWKVLWQYLGEKVASHRQ